MALLVLLSGCSGSHGSPVDATPSWDAIHPTFLPSPLPLSRAIGLAGAAPLGADSTSIQVRRTDVSLMHGLGVARERADLTWSSIEPARGTFDFSGFDSGIADLTAAGITLQPILDYGNAWATAQSCGDDFFAPDNPADFATYAARVAAHLAGKTHRYEIWNEENLGLRFWHPREDASAYAALIEATAPALRAVDPEAVIVLGGLLYNGQANLDAPTYLEEVYETDSTVRTAFDAVAIHPYAAYPPADPPELASATETPEPLMIARIHAVMASHGDGGKPIVVTEVGWPTIAPVTQDLQARWMVRSIVLLLASGARSVDWYNLVDGNDPHTLPAENAFGLFTYAPPGTTPAPKAAAKALTTLLSVCGDLHVGADLRTSLAGLPADGYAYRFEGPAGRATVLWRADETQPAVKVVVPLIGTHITLVALDGTTTPEPAGASITVSVSQAPVYVVER